MMCDKLCETVVCDKLCVTKLCVFEKVVCEKVVCVCECMRGRGGRRGAERSGGADLKTRTPHNFVGKKPRKLDPKIDCN